MVRHGKGKSKAADSEPIIQPHERIQESLRRRMHRNDDPSHRFICTANLNEAWEGYSLDLLLSPNGWKVQDYLEINKNYRKILSILILIDWQGIRTQSFRSSFFRHEGRRDANLPLTIEQLTFLGSAKSLFYDWQFAFTPAVIEYHEGKHIQKIESSTRLPFVERGERMGVGSYGEVLKVSIAREFYQDKSQRTVVTNWSEVKTVAVKVYHSKSSEQDFYEEVKRLDYLKEGYHNSRRVMKHIAAIVHGDTFMIVLPLAELRDLEVFLRGGRQTDGDTRSEKQVYLFEDRFRALNDNATLHRELIRECFEISSALLWLHEELRIAGKLDRYLAHMDLKPDNILIDSEEGHPAGKWMISDFGVSLFDKATNKLASDVFTARDLGRRATSRADQTIVLRNRVGYSPPEIGLPDYDGRKCDVWSFVCILCDVLAFALERTQGLHNFREIRSDGDDNFFNAKSGHTDRSRKIDASNTQVKRKIDDWLEAKATENPYPWVSAFVKVIRRGLIPDPSIRPGIRSIMEGLDYISSRLLADTSTSLPASLTWTQSSPSHHLTVPLSKSNSAASGSIQPQEARKSSISFDTSPLRSREDREALQPGTIVMMSTPTLNETPTTMLDDRNDSVRSTSQPSSNSNVSRNVRGESQTNKHQHSDSYDTQASQVTTGRTLVSSGERSRKYIELSPLTLPLKPKAALNAVALRRTGGHVAMLFERRDEIEQRQRYEVYVYPISDDMSGVQKVDLSSGVHWNQIWIAQRYFLVGGQSEGQDLIAAHDLQNESYFRPLHTTHPRYKGKPRSRVTLSDTGIAAAIYGQHLILSDLRLKTREDVELHIDEGYSIKKSAFNAVGNVLCLWAIRSVEANVAAAVDVIYFYNVTISPPELIGKGLYSKADQASLDLDFMPFPNHDACVIREQNGGTFVAYHDQNAETNVIHQRKYTGIPRALVACITFDNMLICIEKHNYLPGKAREIHEYALREQSSSGLSDIGPSSDRLGLIPRSVDEKAQIAVRLTEGGKQMLVICTSRGGILRYLQSD